MEKGACSETLGIACGIFRREIEALQKQGVISNEFIYLDSSLHMEPQVLQHKMEKLTANLGSRNLLLVYGDCHPAISRLCEKENVTRINGINCCEIYLGKEKYQDLISKGYFFLLPEWTCRWRDIFMGHMGFNRSSARDFMGEMHSALLYLDTGIIPPPEICLEEISDFCGLPIEIVQVSLEGFKEELLSGLSNADKDRSTQTNVTVSGTREGSKIMARDDGLNSVRMNLPIDRQPTDASSETREMQDKASSFLMVDLLKNILENASNPGQFAQFIVSQIRELVGAKAVALLTGPDHIVSMVCPQRQWRRFESPEFAELCRKYARDSRAIPLTQEEGCGKGIILPLQAAGEPMGAILVMDLLTDLGENSVLRILENLAGVIGLVLKNAMLYKNLDNLVIARTRELTLEVERHSRSLELLRQENIFIENTLNSMKDMLVVYDPGTRRIIRWNMTFLKLSGYSEKDLRDLDIPTDIFSPEDCLRIENHLKILLKKGFGECGERPEETLDHQTNEKWHENIKADLIIRNGKSIPMEFSPSAVRDVSGGLLYIIVSGRDISERLAAEEERARYEEKLRQTNKLEAIGTLAGGISHDFNNILASILGYAEMASEDLETLRSMDKSDSDSPRVAGSPLETLSNMDRAIKEIVRSGNRARDLIGHILAFSRKQPHIQKPVDPKEIIREILGFLRSTLPSSIMLKHNLDRVEKIEKILGDATQIYQILLNICTNASQAMGTEEGTLEINLEQVCLDSAEAINIPELRPGAYIRSLPGEGTTFSLLLPAMKRECPPEQCESNELIPRGSERILLVDDETALLDLTARRLEKIGYRVTAFSDSQEALNFFLSNPNAIDLLVSDQTMPGLTGDRLAAAIHNLKPDFPVIICSGYSSRLDSEKASSMGIKAFLMKPVDKKDLAQAIRRVLDN